MEFPKRTPSIIGINDSYNKESQGIGNKQKHLSLEEFVSETNTICYNPYVYYWNSQKRGPNSFLRCENLKNNPLIHGKSHCRCGGRILFLNHRIQKTLEPGLNTNEIFTSKAVYMAILCLPNDRTIVNARGTAQV